MVYQTRLDQDDFARAAASNGQGNGQGHGRGLRGSAAATLRDAIELGELQAQLLAADFRAGLGDLRLSIVALIASAGLLVASAPLWLLAMAFWIEAAFELSRVASLLIAGAAGLALSLAAAAASWQAARRGAVTLSRSRDELRKNLELIKQLASTH